MTTTALLDLIIETVLEHTEASCRLYKIKYSHVVEIDDQEQARKDLREILRNGGE